MPHFRSHLCLTFFGNKGPLSSSLTLDMSTSNVDEIIPSKIHKYSLHLCIDDHLYQEMVSQGFFISFLYLFTYFNQ